MSRARRLTALSLVVAACNGGGYSLGRGDSVEDGGAANGASGNTAGALAASGAADGGDGSAAATGEAGTAASTHGGSAGSDNSAGADSGSMGGTADGSNGGNSNSGGNANAGALNGGGNLNNGGTPNQGGSANNGGTAGSSGGSGGSAGNGGSTGTAPTGIAERVVPGYDFACALSAQGEVKCWGDNKWGQLGQGDVQARGIMPGQMGANLKPIDLGTGRHALSVVTGDMFACALLDNHSVKCWGKNQYGQLGQGDTLTRGDEPNEMGDNLKPIDLGTGRTAISIGAESVDVCVVLDDKTVKCWGFDGGGELALGTESPGGSVLARGDEPNEMGDNLPRTLLGKKKAVSISAGMYYACALFEDATIKCWGTNSPPVLGYGDTNIRGNWLPELGDKLLAVDVGKGRTVKSVAAGNYHTCAILDNDATKCWGSNFYGQLGYGDNVTRGGNPGEMGDSLPVVDLGTGRHAVQLSLGNTDTCAVLDNGTLKCWGANSFGQAGTGDTVQRGDEPNEMGDNLPVVNLGAGRTVLRVGTSRPGFNTTAQTDTGGWKAWGDNEYAQLGLGKKSLDVGVTPSDMGDNLPYLDLGF